MTEYFWPCSKRTAHGPHPYNHDRDGHDCAPEECGGSRQDPCSSTEECIGVKAHPNTQIGRGSLKEVPSKITQQTSIVARSSVSAELLNSKNPKWPTTVTQIVPEYVWRIEDSKITRINEGDWVRLLGPDDLDCEYRVESFDPDTGEAVLRRAGS